MRLGAMPEAPERRCGQVPLLAWDLYLQCHADACTPHAPPPACLALPCVRQVGRLVPETVRGLVMRVAPHAQQLVNAFGIPDHLVAAPIAANWERYNT